MMKANKWVAGTLLLALLSGCATSRNSFYADPMSVGDAQICRSLAGEEARGDATFQSALRSELRLRGVNEADCASIVQDQNVAIGVGAILGAAIVAAAASSHGDDVRHYHGGRSETYIDINIDVPPAAPVVVARAPVDTQWDWDQYYNPAGSMVWGCRGVQTRVLVDPERCSGKEMTDARWPAKTI